MKRLSVYYKYKQNMFNKKEDLCPLYFTLLVVGLNHNQSLYNVLLAYILLLIWILSNFLVYLVLDYIMSSNFDLLNIFQYIGCDLLLVLLLSFYRPIDAVYWLYIVLIIETLSTKCEPIAYIPIAGYPMPSQGCIPP